MFLFFQHFKPTPTTKLPIIICSSSEDVILIGEKSWYNSLARKDALRNDLPESKLTKWSKINDRQSTA
jgi:hypothetical protein